MWRLFNKLRKSGVMSINKRNKSYVLQYNRRKYYPLVDNKLQSKKLAIAHNINVPPLYATIESEHQLKKLESILDPFSDFVIKPAHGAGGDGIVVIRDRVMGRYRQINGELLTIQDLQYHISRLLSGAFSLSGHPDFAIIEYRVQVDPVFASVSYEGVPDIRVITLLGYPAMAMLRLPTRLSGGKANLHQGAIGVGVDLATGKTLAGVHHNDPIDFHPDTLESIIGLTVPYWQQILTTAASCFELTNLGYLGVDIVLDKTHGPLMLELNARPGLNIQIANAEGALKRYQKIENHAELVDETVEQRVKFSQQRL
ncbi:alpha-L-glutamate ligase-like protein [Legionella sp. W05-934-2]|jgi:alpha-L-glutamate ligase-like protein|uniref:alpha-L-glutamate ligase-like protein n=1 Tax=Legionella sp. W05-934-2 TaxID=1198649 RepID=UPI0034635F0D